MKWYAQIIEDQANLQPVTDACDYFDQEYDAAVLEVDVPTIRGLRFDEMEKRLPGIVGRRYYQLQELEAILGYLHIRQTAIKGTRRRHYLEQYNRTLTATTAEKYVESDDEVLKMAMLINRVALTRNKFLGLSKQHEYLHYNLGNLSRLLAAGVHDAVL